MNIIKNFWNWILSLFEEGVMENSATENVKTKPDMTEIKKDVLAKAKKKVKAKVATAKVETVKKVKAKVETVKKVKAKVATAKVETVKKVKAKVEKELVTGRYSKEESEKLLDFIGTDAFEDVKFDKIASALNRDVKAVRQKVRKIFN